MDEKTKWYLDKIVRLCKYLLFGGVICFLFFSLAALSYEKLTTCQNELNNLKTLEKYRLNFSSNTSYIIKCGEKRCYAYEVIE